MSTTNKTFDPAADTYPIQNFLFAKKGAPDTIYARNENAEELLSEKTGSVQLQPGQRVCGNTYFNTLYLEYWRTYADIGQIGFKVHFRGELSVRIVGIDANDEVITLSRQIFSSDDDTNSKVLWAKDAIGNPQFGETTKRIFAEITCLSPTTLFEMAYVTNQAPVRDVSLSVGLCTFNREEELSVTLHELVEFQSKTPALKDIYLVNQGKSFLDPKLNTLLETSDVHLFEQGNFGGCGGFNRTMIEAVSQNEFATYHLLMDDDIWLDTRVIQRALTFLNFAKDDIAIGGQMLNLENKKRLHEAGAKLHKYWWVESIGQGTDLDKTSELKLFNECHDIDYNAWWFCMIPSASIQKLGYSLPLFLHFDDIEYGCRLKRDGVRTVSLPGVGVWHESFTYKKNDWILYYDMRNRLINSAIHPQISEPPDALFVLGFLMNFILIHRYRAAKMSARAVRDFLSGPEFAFGIDPETKHEELVAFLNETTAPPLRENLNSEDYAQLVRSPGPDGTWPTIKLFFTNFFRISLPRIGKRKPLMAHGGVHPGTIGSASYLLANNAEETDGQFLEPNRFYLWTATADALLLTLIYAFKNKSVSRKWLTSLPKLQSSENWKRIFAKAKRNQ